MRLSCRVDHNGLSCLKVSIYRYLGNRHLVKGQRPGFIAADNCSTPKSLHRRQLTDQSVSFSHTLNPQSHNNGSRGGQPLWNNGNGQRNSHQELRNQRPVVNGADGKDQHTDNDPNDGQCFTHRAQLTLKRRIRLILTVEHTGNVTHLCVHARCHHHTSGTAIGDNGGGIGHVAPVTQYAALRKQLIRVLF
ncbi:hypothetical protein SDC9_131121 [bioreactor metagenome]|uniref:Uncharacterized protein n=1 Tax=bioreactor metagenome TaxID=1076179 RepID=A0A645D3I1_9ZZZZ